MTLLEMRDICKYFGDIKANHNVSFQVEEGEVHALLGENGAGKSTLMNVLYGLFPPTHGEIYWKGKKTFIDNPKDAIDKGIGMVHQHFMLIPALSVIENVVLGMKEGEKGFLDLEGSAERFQALADKYNLVIDPWARVCDLSVGVQQRLEILKALYKGADLLILDEPTAVLTPQEVTELFNMIHSLTEEGKTVILITHKLDEIKAIADRCTILRLGETKGTVDVKETSTKELVQRMVGREVVLDFEIDEACRQNLVLSVKHLTTKNKKGVKVLDDINLEVYEGEIFGIIGVDGNGQTELVDCITGLLPHDEGTISISGTGTDTLSPREILELGVGHIPEDRHKRGIVTNMYITENMLMMDYFKKPCKKDKVFLDWRYIENRADEWIEKYNIKCGSRSDQLSQLSGGNQQKVVLAREIEKRPKLMVAMQPVRGLDIGATEFVHQSLVELRDNCGAVLLVTTELFEVMNLSDRIAVIFDGQIMGIVERGECSKEELGFMMAGTRKEDLQKHN